MARICPTVLAPNIDEFRASLERIRFAQRVQIDIADGTFASPRSVSPSQIYWDEHQQADIHLMYADPYHNLEALIAKQPNMVILHAEAPTFEPAFDYIKHLGLTVGIALLPDTQPESVSTFLRQADHCLIFGGQLGSYGGEADLNQLQKVATVRAINPKIETGWDGGANVQTIKAIADAGIDIINVGSAIQKADNPQEAYATLSDIIQGNNDAQTA